MRPSLSPKVGTPSLAFPFSFPFPFQVVRRGSSSQERRGAQLLQKQLQRFWLPPWPGPFSLPFPLPFPLPLSRCAVGGKISSGPEGSSWPSSSDQEKRQWWKGQGEG